jgi:hypothetical protein
MLRQPQLLRILLQYISQYQQAKRNGETPPEALQGFAITALMVDSLQYVNCVAF